MDVATDWAQADWASGGVISHKARVDYPHCVSLAAAQPYKQRHAPSIVRGRIRTHGRIDSSSALTLGCLRASLSRLGGSPRHPFRCYADWSRGKESTVGRLPMEGLACLQF